MSPRQIWKRFIQIEKGWSGDNKLKTCLVKCNNKFDPYVAQWN